MPELYKYYTKAGSLFQGHLNIMARALFCTQTTSLAEVVVKFVESGGLRLFNGIVRAIHIAVATIETEPTAKASVCLGNNIILFKGWINLFETLESHMDRPGLLLISLDRLIVIGVQFS